MYKTRMFRTASLPYDGTIQDNVRHLAALPLLFNPGDRFEYSLVSMSWVTWLKWFLTRHWMSSSGRAFFEPLGMSDTYFYPPENKLNRLAAAYTFYPEKASTGSRLADRRRKLHVLADYPYRGAKKLYSGGGGCVRLRPTMRASAR